MQGQAEQISRECLSKYVKQAEEVSQVFVGKLIGEGHVNYVLMYNMLTVLSPPKVHVPLQPHAYGPLHSRRTAMTAAKQPCYAPEGESEARGRCSTWGRLPILQRRGHTLVCIMIA